MFGKCVVNVFLLVGFLVLSVCGSQQFVGIGVVVFVLGFVISGIFCSSFGVYQFSFSGVGSVIKQVSVQCLGVQVIEVGGLSFKSNNYGYYVDSLNNILWMWVMFDVINISDQFFVVLIFILVDIEGVGGIIGIMVFKNVCYFDGSDVLSCVLLLVFDLLNDFKMVVKIQLFCDFDSGSVQVNLFVGL